jgi:hypothetical protein
MTGISAGSPLFGGGDTYPHSTTLVKTGTIQAHSFFRVDGLQAHPYVRVEVRI